MASSPAPPILTAQAPPFLGSQGEVRVFENCSVTDEKLFVRGSESIFNNHFLKMIVFYLLLHCRLAPSTWACAVPFAIHSDDLQ